MDLDEGTPTPATHRTEGIGGRNATPPDKVVGNAIRNVVGSVARVGFRAVTRVARKDGSVVITSSPDFDDSVRAVLPELLARGASVTILAATDRPRPAWVPTDLPVLPLKSTDAFRAFLRASVVYFTHGLYGSFVPVKGQTVVNLWHGMPIKRIDRGTGVRGPSCSMTIASSAAFRPALASAFRLDEADVEITGLPRNDLLTDPSLPDPAIVSEAVGAPKYLVMLPTYRTSTMGPGRLDSTDESLLLGPADRDELDRVLRRDDLALVVKPHPVSPPGVMDSWRSDRVVVIDDAWLAERGVTLYGMLSGARLLVTDYSSVCVDFAVTGRACLLYQPDHERYEADRGLTLSEEAMATLGDAVTDPTSLIAGIAAASARGFTRSTPVSDQLVATPPTGATGRVLDVVARRLS